MHSPSPSPLDSRTVKSKKAIPTLPATVGASTTFFLRKEKDMDKEKSTTRGRRPSQLTVDTAHSTPQGSPVGERAFGVQSLKDTIRNPSDTSLSRSTSQSSARSSDSLHSLDPEGRISSRKRKAGNRVHPTILAAGRRIISSDGLTNQSQASSNGSPASIPFTPTKSPCPGGSVTPSTPRSASPKSFRLSDEDSVADDRSQAVISSNEDEDEHTVERTPQLVMPSLPVRSRRPFTDQGRRLGRAKVMVVGRSGTGKTSFISSLVRSTEHIVHVDQLRPTASHSSFNTETSDKRQTTLFTETQASTRPFPPFWTDMEYKRPRSNSIGSGILERNLTFVDTLGLDDDAAVERILEHVKLGLQRTADLNNLSDAEIVSLLSGEGGVQLDAVFFLFGPVEEETNAAQRELIRFLCKSTNLIPLISRADTLAPDALRRRKDQVNTLLRDIQAEPYRLSLSDNGTEANEPLAISSALGSDEDIIDASILMSSQYLQPLIPSELGFLIESFFDSSNFARMRHQSATKLVFWRRENMSRADLHAQTFLGSPYLRSQSPGMTSTGSFPGEPSKVMVPHSSSSYYRSSSPSDACVPPGGVSASDFTLAKHNEQEQPAEPLRQMRLAKWAQDLQRGLENERRKYRELYSHRRTEWKLDDEEKNEKQALVSANTLFRPARGRLGGDIGVYDPRDPLGVLAFGQSFGRRSFLSLQLIGGCGLLGAAAYWIFKNWMIVQGFFGFSSQPDAFTAAAMSVRRHSMNLFDDIRAFLAGEC